MVEAINSSCVFRHRKSILEAGILLPKLKVKGLLVLSTREKMVLRCWDELMEKQAQGFAEQGEKKS